MHKLASIILFPFSFLYSCVTALRNKLFDLNVLKSIPTKSYSIGIGNLHMGGTGKTPMVLWLIKYACSAKLSSVLSRGYGRYSTGYFELPIFGESSIYGDEPVMIKNAFPKLGVFVCEKRKNAIPKIRKSRPNDQFLILDDIMQHRHLTPNHLIMLSPYNAPFYNEAVVPSGKLREHKKGYKRANTIVITKCPNDLSIEMSRAIEQKIKPYSHQKIFFSTIKYGQPIPLFEHSSSSMSKNVILVTGIANAKGFKEYVKTHYNIIEHFEYSDHYNFTNKDIQNWLYFFGKDPSVQILTTEKDVIRLKAHESLRDINIQYIPIETDFLFNQADNFIQQII